MVSLVIVSHSAKLAEGVAELMRGMAGPEVQIAAAGGVDLPDHPLGTDVNLIAQAIQRVYSEDGVVVLVDLGSAILSTEMALETFSPAQRERIVIAPAALVEGGIAAAVQARIGSPLDDVVKEARSALDGKLAELGGAVPPPAPSHVSMSAYPTQRVRLAVRNRLGLHARPAARFVQTAAQFEGDVLLKDVTTGQGPVNAKSINAVTTLDVLQGHEIEITAAGPNAPAALAAFQKLAEENFGDGETTDDEGRRTNQDRPPTANRRPLNADPIAQGEFVGMPASPGYAIGKARMYRPQLPPIPQNTIDDPEREWARLQTAIQQAHEQLKATRAALNGRGNLPEAEIFDAQGLMLEDEALQEPARRAIFEHKLNAATAFEQAATQVAARYEKLNNEYLRARAADVRAVARQVLLNLFGGTHDVTQEAGILVAADLTPAETAVLNPNTVQALCLAFSVPTSHSAILAKSLGIPTVVGLGEKILEWRDGDNLIVDGERGRVWHHPDAALVEEYSARIDAARHVSEAARRAQEEPAITQDGHRVEIAANIGSVKDAQQAVALGADAVGLFRTEFLFLDRRTAPAEAEQYETYRAVAEVLQGRSLLIRTLDIGGDKPLPYVNVPREANPFLGLRGLRLSLAQPELFKTQLRAILRMASEFPVRVMFPMVSTIKEYRAALEMMKQAHDELQTRGIAVPDHVETGIMVEVPSAALAAEQFAREVDFFSLGTNDLTQYTLAAERGNPQVAALADSFHPAVLQLIANVVNAAHAHGKWVGVCGELGGDPRAIPLLVGLGVDELSMSPPLISHAKQIVRGLNFVDAQANAPRALTLSS